MRRQARITAGGALVWRSASALQVWLWLLIFIFQNEFRICRSIKPGYLDFDNLPDTNFTCAGKVIGGYYADLETSCQMFHVCTVGQQDEPMDIKFLCLNGTVFDQETRVCERVDEVDCTKSEKFYSLNLELYGSTAPPIIQSDQQKPQATEQSQQQTKPSQETHTDSSADVAPTTSHDKHLAHLPDFTDSTEDPVQEIKRDDPIKSQPTSTNLPIQILEHEDLTEEYQEEDEIDGDYEDYSHAPTSTTTQAPTTTTTMVTTTTTMRPTITTPLPSTSSRFPSPIPHFFSSPAPIVTSLSPPAPSIPSAAPPSQSIPTLDPFNYHHRSPGSEAISFQSLRPADGVYITHAPPQQYDHFQYESSRTAPRPVQQRPTPFVQRPQPQPFRLTTLDPRDQLLRPGPTSQPSERHETSVKHRQQNYPASALPAQRPLPFNPFYYDRKRSDDTIPENESSLSARSVAPPTVTERSPPKMKSPPRVIVTASASVSDSNGKRLNYTVGNVVSAVKPIVPINYDDYKESDLIFDPFFLDVPKLQKRRKTRSNNKRKVFTVPAAVTISSDFAKGKSSTTTIPVTSRATTTNRASTTKAPVTTTKAAWNPNDYVDDNYEPHAYIPPIPPLAVLVAHDLNKFMKERQMKNDLVGERSHRDHNSKAGRVDHSKPTSPSALQTTSSQSGDGGAVPAASPPPAPPVEAPCASRPADCRTRA